MENVNNLREHLPLKQGLRLKRLILVRERHSTQRASSTKTRIKTANYIARQAFVANSESIFH